MQSTILLPASSLPFVPTISLEGWAPLVILTQLRTLQSLLLAVVHVKDVLRFGKPARLDIGRIARDRVRDDRGKVGIPLHELGPDVLIKPEHVMENQDLPVAVSARPYPYSRNVH